MLSCHGVTSRNFQRHTSMTVLLASGYKYRTHREHPAVHVLGVRGPSGQGLLVLHNSLYITPVPAFWRGTARSYVTYSNPQACVDMASPVTHALMATTIEAPTSYGAKTTKQMDAAPAESHREDKVHLPAFPHDWLSSIVPFPMYLFSFNFYLFFFCIS
jgi:hypothetical protein